MNKKGQALVEFILIMPVIIFLVITAFDYVNIYQNKVILDNYLDELILDESYKIPKNIKFEKENDVFILSMNVSLYSPIMRSIYDDNYHLEAKRFLS